jgi:hypothetical protein
MKTIWPSKGPDFNSWNVEFARFMKILASARNERFWVHDWKLKYLNIRVDTRDNGFLIFADADKPGDERERIDPQRVVDAIEANRDRYPHLKLTEHAVMTAYAEYLRLKVRRMKIENTRQETPEEAEERLAATEAFNTLELQYEAQFVK